MRLVLAVLLGVAAPAGAETLEGAYSAASGEARSWQELRALRVADRDRKIREDRPELSGAETLSGTLRIAPGGSVALAAMDGGLLTLADGPVRLTYGRPSLWSFFTGDRRLALEQGGRVAVFQTSASLFRSFDRFKTLPGPHGVTLQGRNVDVETGSVERERKRSCTYAGHCMQCGPKVGIDGQIDHGCGFGFWMNCSGDETVRERAVSFQRVDAILLLSEPGGHPLGEITSPPRSLERVETLAVLKSCG